MLLITRDVYVLHNVKYVPKVLITGVHSMNILKTILNLQLSARLLTRHPTCFTWLIWPLSWMRLEVEHCSWERLVAAINCKYRPIRGCKVQSLALDSIHVCTWSTSPDQVVYVRLCQLYLPFSFLVSPTSTPAPSWRCCPAPAGVRESSKFPSCSYPHSLWSVRTRPTVSEYCVLVHWKWPMIPF